MPRKEISNPQQANPQVKSRALILSNVGLELTVIGNREQTESSFKDTISTKTNLNRQIV